jgi:hypothetical protein
MNQLYSIRSILVVVLSLVSAFASARTISDLDAVYKAATQRTLVMRIAKNHIQLATGVDYQSAKIDLSASIEEFDQLLGQLELNSPTSAINQRVLGIKKIWQSYRVKAESLPSQESVLALLESSNDLIFQSDLLMREWQGRLLGVYGENIDLVQQQSMLSERIGAFYLAQYMGIRDGWVKAELEHTIQAYNAGMEQLRISALDVAVDPLIVAQLSSNWEYAKLNLEQYSAEKFVPVVMMITMQSMYKQTNNLAMAYHVRDRIALNGGQLYAESALAANIEN